MPRKGKGCARARPFFFFSYSVRDARREEFDWQVLWVDWAGTGCGFSRVSVAWGAWGLTVFPEAGVQGTETERQGRVL